MDIRQAKDQIKNAMVAYYFTRRTSSATTARPTERQSPRVPTGSRTGKRQDGHPRSQIRPRNLGRGVSCRTSMNATTSRQSARRPAPSSRRRPTTGVDVRRCPSIHDERDQTPAVLTTPMGATGQARGHPVPRRDQLTACRGNADSPPCLQFLQYKRCSAGIACRTGWIVETGRQPARVPPHGARTSTITPRVDRLKGASTWEPRTFAAWRDFRRGSRA